MPDQTPLDVAAETQSPVDVQFEEQTDALAADLDVDVAEIVTHDNKRPIVNFARHRGVDAIVTQNDGTVVLRYPSDDETPEQRRRTIDEYQDEVADLLSVPVETASLADERSGESTDLRVRRGADNRLRGGLFDRAQAVPTDDTEVIVYTHESRQPSFVRRLFERLFF